MAGVMSRSGQSYNESARVERLAQMLRRAPLFAGLGDLELRTVVSALRRVTLKRGTLLFSQGDAGNAAYMVSQGHVDLILTTPEGRELIVSQAGSGDIFGEMALIEDTTRSAAAIAHDDCELFTLGRDDFMRLLQQHPTITLALLRAMSQRLRRTTEHASDLAFKDVPSRIAKALLDLDDQTAAGRPIEITHEHLAGLAGTSRQTTTLILNDWKRDGVLELGRRKVLVLDRDALVDRIQSG